MIFGKHINRYYAKYALWLIAGLGALVLVDFLQLEIPKLYRTVINGMNMGYVVVDGVQMPFSMDFVLDEVCKLLKSSPELADISVSINMPMAQLLESGFVPRFIGTVNQAGIDHRRICIEFTERAILENFQKTHNVMQKLAYEGFQFYLDDFGTGYSNFNCLLQLPFQIIKLDTSVVHAEVTGLSVYTMPRMLTKLFHDMNLLVVAEGVEKVEEVRALTKLGVDRVQGYALARPMPVDTLLNFYREHQINDN